MTNLLVNALVGILVIAVTWFVASLLLPGNLALIITVVVAVLVLIYLIRGGKALP